MLLNYEIVPKEDVWIQASPEVSVEKSGGLYTVAKTADPGRLRAPGRKSTPRNQAIYNVRKRITPTYVILRRLWATTTPAASNPRLWQPRPEERRLKPGGPRGFIVKSGGLYRVAKTGDTGRLRRVPGRKSTPRNPVKYDVRERITHRT